MTCEAHEKSQYPSLFKIVRIEKRKGTGKKEKYLVEFLLFPDKLRWVKKHHIIFDCPCVSHSWPIVLSS